MPRSAAPWVLALVGALGLGACSAPSVEPGPTLSADASSATPAGGSPISSPTSDTAQPTSSPSASASAGSGRARIGSTSTLARGLEVPWGLAFLSDGSALVAERRSGRVLRVSPDGAVTAVGTVPGVLDRGEGGLLGLAVEPGEDATVFAYLTTDEDNRVVALPFDGDGFGPARVLLAGIPAGSTHNGGRLVVGPDGRLWIGTGDAGDPARAQRRSDLGGKVLRIALDGSVPADNPFGSAVWSFGHRNVQGLAFDSAGRLWATEFGQNRLDELNRIERGGNYGWPLVEGTGGGDRFVDPQVTWPTSEASPSGLAIVDDVAFVAGLRGQRVWQVPVVGGRAGRPQAALRGDYGRIRTIEPAPDGTLWITTSNRDGRGSPRDGDDRVVTAVVRSS
jgi:glucose/arabinose dehydrogenase